MSFERLYDGFRDHVEKLAGFQRLGFSVSGFRGLGFKLGFRGLGD